PAHGVGRSRSPGRIAATNSAVVTTVRRSSSTTSTSTIEPPRCPIADRRYPVRRTRLQTGVRTPSAGVDGVRRRWEVAMSRIVVGVHNSLAGLCALRRAVAEARRRGVALHAVRAWPPTPSPRAIAIQPWREVALQEATVAVHHAFSEAMGGIPIDLDVHILVTAGPPGPPLPGYADFVARNLAPLRRDAARVVGDESDADVLYQDVLTDVAARWSWLQLGTALGRSGVADTYLNRAFARRSERWHAGQADVRSAPDIQVWRADARPPRRVRSNAAARLAPYLRSGSPARVG